MKAHTKVAALCGLLCIAGSAGAQSSSWGDAGAAGLRQSASTAAANPGRYAADGDRDTTWKLTPGAASGWVETFWASPTEIPGLTVDAKVPEGAALAVSVLVDNQWVPVAGSRIVGPFDGERLLVFPRELGRTTRYLLTLEGAASAEASVREVSIPSRESIKPFGKILPKTYTLNQKEYINLKADRLWDGVGGNAWFEPLWSFPWEVFQTNEANKPTEIFPPYHGNPPKKAEIIWELDGDYEISTLKANFLANYRSLRFEFWDGAQWVNAQTFGDGWGDSGKGWQRIDLAQPITTSRVRVTFPGGWERARFIGELEVWGSGWAARSIRPLVLGDAGPDNSRLITIEDADERGFVLEVIADTYTGDSLEGDLNGNGFTTAPYTWINNQTVYRLNVSERLLRDGTQFLWLREAASVRAVLLRRLPADGRLPLGWPYADGIYEGTEAAPGGTVPSWSTKTWDLGADYSLERIRVYSGTAAPLTLKLGNTDRHHHLQWTTVAWTAQKAGWWEADLEGREAEKVLLESTGSVAVDEVQLYGTRLSDDKVGMELWWPKKKPVTSDRNDGNSVIGWMGDPDVNPSISGHHPRQQDKLFWMPLSQLGMEPDEDWDFDLSGTLGSASFDKRFRVKWTKSPPGTFEQGEGLLSTVDETAAISGTIADSRYRVYIDGTEVPTSSKRYSIVKPLSDGYQKVLIEVWDKYKRKRLISWTKEVYKNRGLPKISFDLPYGDTSTQLGTYTLCGRTGNGLGLSLSVNGVSVPLDGGSYAYPISLIGLTAPIHFELTDGLGRKTTADLSFASDSTAPVIKIDAPTAGQYLASSSIDFIASAGGEGGLWWKINNENWEYDSAHPHKKTYSLADGFYKYTVTAQDKAGNVSETKEVNFVVDVTPPADFPLQCNVSGWTGNRSPVLTFATTDATSGLDHFEYSLDGSEWKTALSPLTLPNLPDGTHRVFVKALDKAGNSTVKTLLIYTDATNPAPFAVTANVSGWASNNRPTLSFATTDATSGVDRYEVKIDTGSWTVQSSPYQVPLLSDGQHTVQARAFDKTGNQAATPILTLNIDATPPAAFTTAANVSGWTSNNRPTVSVTTTDATSGISRYEVKIDDGEWSTQQSPYQVPKLDDGIHAITARAVDNAGNTTSSPVTVYIDTAPPVAVKDLRLIPGSNRMDTLWSTVDTDVAVYHVERIEGTVTTSFDTALTKLADENLTPGTTLQYKVRPEDRAGNLGPWVTADAAIAGMAVKPLSTAADTATLVEYQHIKMAVPAAALPPEVKVVLINEIESPEMAEKTANPIVGPIYSFSTLQDDGNGNLVEASHTEFNHEVMVVLDYDETKIPNGFPESNLGVYYYDTLWARWFRVEKAVIDIEQNKIVFFTNHFSEFSVQPTLMEDLKPQELADAGHSPYKSESRAGEVSVSPQGGTMMTEVTEFVLKGKNGYTFPVKRIYDTQTARVDSPSMNLALSLGLNFSADIPAQIASQLVSIGVGLAVDSTLDKLIGMFKKNGDYPLAMGVGWRLNLPFVTANDTSVMVRLPSGGYYGINQMNLQGDAPIVSAIRSLTFENHRGEDFTFRVHQIRGDISSIAAGQLRSTIKSSVASLLTKPKNDSSPEPTLTGTLSMLGSMIPGWWTISSELITKDGTSYSFDPLGRVVSITDPSGTNVISVTYNGFVISKITDPMGNEVRFEYNDGAVSGLFLRPSITKIETAGPEGTRRSSRYEYDTGDHLSVGFMSLPAMTAAWDVGGRKTTYGIDKRFLFSGGGSAKINFLSALLDFIPGAAQLKSALGLYSLTISGHLNFEWPRLVNRIDAPGAGITEIAYKDKDLSSFDARPADYLFGWIPTALKISYEFLYRIITDSVTVRNGDIAKTTSYDYHFTVRRDQWLVDKATINDGLTSVVQEYSIHERGYNRYVSFDDAMLAALRSGLFTEESNWIVENFPLAVKTTTVDLASGAAYQTEDTAWDVTHSRPTTKTSTRGPAYVQTVHYAYDNWGNETNVTTTRTTPQGSTQLTRQSWYQGTSSTVPAGVPAGIPGTPAQTVSENKGLLLGTVTSASLPVNYFGPAQDVTYQAYAYDNVGRPVWQGLWTGDHWAASARSYYPVTEPFDTAGQLVIDPLSGRLRETIGATGQRTLYSYDFTALKARSLWTERKTSVAVADPRGLTTDVVEETAYDWGTGWPRLTKTPEGFLTETRYDALGRPVSIIKPGDEAALPLGEWTAGRVQAPWDRIAYDDTARTAALYRDIAAGTTPAAAVNEPGEFYQYDQRGNLTRITKYERSGSPVRESVTQAAYDAYNRVVSMTDPNGRATTYSYDFNSRPLSTHFADGTRQLFSYDDTIGVKETTNERDIVTRESLNWSGKPELTVADSGGLNITTRTWYDGLDRVSAVVDPLGQVTLTAYSPFGKPSLVRHPAVDIFTPPAALPATMPAITTAAAQPTETTAYDDEGRPEITRTGTDGAWRTTTTTYDGLGRPIKEDKDGRETWTWYNGSGKPVRQSDGEQTAILKAAAPGVSLDASGAAFTLTTYTGRNQIETQTDPSGAVTRYAYDRDDHKILMRDPRAQGTRLEDFSIHCTYDDLGRLTAADLPPVTGQTRGAVSIAYDLRGNPVSQTDPDGKATTWTYDARNRKTSQTVTGTDGKTLITAWGYDAAGNTVKEIVVKSYNSGNPAGSSGLVTTKEYDALNRVTLVTLPDDQKTVTEYDALGRVTETRDALDNTTTYAYNSLNKVTVKTESENKVTRNAYNIWGEATATTFEGADSGTQVWARAYNAHGQIAWERNNAGQTWTYSYDLRGLVIGGTDPNGTSTVTTYSLTGLPLQRTLTNGGKSQSQSWTYDEAGAMKSASDGSIATVINQGSGAYVADPYDLITSYATIVGGKTLATATSYDKGRRPISLTYPDNQTITYQYDGLGQLTTVPGYAVNGQYNFAGRLTNLEAANGTGRVKTWNDVRGTLDGYQWTGTGKEARVLDWDIRGNLSGQTKDGHSSTYYYDGQNRLQYAYEGWPVEVNTKDNPDAHYGVRERDVAGRNALDFNNGTASLKFDYHAASVGLNLETEQAVNKIRLNRAGSRVSERTLEVYVSTDGTDDSWTKVAGTTFVYDQEGVTIQFAQPVSARYVKVHSTWDERDAENRAVDNSAIAGTPAQLIEVWFTSNGQTTNWTYDSLGNRITEGRYNEYQSTVSHEYYANSNLPKAKGSWRFNYDANGNMTSRGTGGAWNGASYEWDAASGELWTYGYDLKNRLIEVKHGKAGATSLKTIANYAYDIRDLRVQTTKAGETTYYQYDQSGDLLWTEAGVKSTRYVQILGQIWAEVRTVSAVSATYFHHTDHLGSSETITDSSGAVVWSGTYEAYGKLSRTNGTLKFTPSYTGKQLDEDTGLYYHNARWYDPQLGRFISEDPARDEQNWYAYCNNSPLRRVDPTGLYIIPVSSRYKMNNGAWRTLHIGTGADEMNKSGCAVALSANILTETEKLLVTPLVVNSQKSLFSGSDIDLKKAAETYGLKYDYWTAKHTDLTKKIRELANSEKAYALGAQVNTGDVNGDGKNDFHWVSGNGMDFIDGKMYLKISATSENDKALGPRVNAGWVTKDGETFVPMSEVNQIRTFEKPGINSKVEELGRKVNSLFIKPPKDEGIKK